MRATVRGFTPVKRPNGSSAFGAPRANGSSAKSRASSSKAARSGFWSHGPDESLDLAYWEKLTLALSEVLAALPEENERKEVP